MGRILRTYKLMVVDVLNLNPKRFISKEYGLPKSILWHKKGHEHKPEEITWDKLLARHVHLRAVEAENILRGDGWFVVFCSFLINMLVLGFFKSLGILVIEIRNDFHTTPADVSLIVCVTYSLNSIAGPLACFMVVKYSPRAVALTGTILVASGLILSCFATSSLHMCFTIGVLGGFGSGLTYSPGLILVGGYFAKNRGLPNGVVVSGSPVGGMIVPSVLSFLISYLGCRGALLVMGGLMLNACICALAFKNPSELETPIVKFYDGRNSNVVASQLDSGYCLLSQPQASHADQTNIRRLSGKAGKIRKSVKPSSIFVRTTSSQSAVDSKIQECYGRETRWKQRESRLVKVPKIHLGSKVMFGERPWGPYKRSIRKSANSQPEKDKPANNSSKRPHKRRNVDKKTNKDVSQHVIAVDHSCVVLLSNQNLARCRKKVDSLKIGEPIQESKERKSRKDSEPPREPREAGHLVKDINDNLRFEEICSLDENDQCEAEEQDVDSTEPPKKEKRRCCYNYWCKDNKYFSLSAIKIVLRNPLYIILLLSNATPAIGSTNVFLLIPSFAKHLGMNRATYSSIYLMVSLLDLIGRLLGTYLSDKGIFRPRTVYASGLLIAGTFSVLMGACKDYLTLVSVCSVFGFASGLHIGILGVLLQDIVGTELLPPGYAFSMILNGALVLIGPYVCGYILSNNPGSYWPMYSVFGIILICGSLLWLIPLCKPKSKGIRDDNADIDEIDDERSVSDESSDSVG